MLIIIRLDDFIFLVEDDFPVVRSTPSCVGQTPAPPPYHPAHTPYQSIPQPRTLAELSEVVNLFSICNLSLFLSEDASPSCSFTSALFLFARVVLVPLNHKMRPPPRT